MDEARLKGIETRYGPTPPGRKSGLIRDLCKSLRAAWAERDALAAKVLELRRIALGTNPTDMEDMHDRLARIIKATNTRPKEDAS